ncbi:MAG: MBL fold metallo-hydrolase [Deltaproteobacteria bacterium]|nr:MBL fold metallo-hydrolase [Deltaproteobacteria bacterium]
MKTGIREMAEGIFMITLPMPFRLKHVNIFLFLEKDGFTLIDTGPNLNGVLPALEASLAEIGRRVEDCRRIWITHFHMDHCGLAGIIAGRSGASVYLSEIEELTVRTFAREEDRASRIRCFAREQGLDGGTIDTVIRTFSAFRTATSPFSAAGFLTDGDRLTVGGRRVEVIATPGHSRGHISFHLPEERFLIAGDHILPHITPNLSPDLIAPDFHPLESFLSSLSRVGDLPVRRVCPAHGRPFSDLKGRISEMREHHRERSERALRALAEGPRNCGEVSRFIFGENLSPFDRLLALNETYVHLIRLERETLICREKRNGVCLFSRSRSSSAGSP